MWMSINIGGLGSGESKVAGRYAEPSSPAFVSRKVRLSVTSLCGDPVKNRALEGGTRTSGSVGGSFVFQRKARRC